MGANCRGSKSDSRMGVGMERQDPSYGAVVHTSVLRVQALLGGSNSPTSRSPEAVDWIMWVWITGVRTLYTEEGVAYIVYARPLRPSVMQGLKYIKSGALLVTLVIKRHNDH